METRSPSKLRLHSRIASRAVCWTTQRGPCGRSLNLAVTAFLAFAFFASAVVPAAFASDLVVVVNSGNEVTGLSLHELRRMYRGEQKQWKSGRPIQVLLPSRSSAAMQSVVANVFEMRSTVEVAQYYMAAMYQGKIVQPPPTVPADQAIEIVANPIGALALVPRSRAEGKAGVKIIPVEGI